MKSSEFADKTQKGSGAKLAMLLKVAGGSHNYWGVGAHIWWGGSTPDLSCIQGLSFRAGVLSIPKGRPQEYFTLAPEWAGTPLVRVAFWAI